MIDLSVFASEDNIVAHYKGGRSLKGTENEKNMIRLLK